MEAKPLLSVIICVWNQEELVIKALDSIPTRGKELRNDIEIIIVDDGSTDNTLKEIDKWVCSDRNRFCKVTVIPLGEDLGVGIARNKGLEAAEGEYVHFLDSDDYLYPQEYEKAMKYLGRSDIVYIDLEMNNGYKCRLNPKTKKTWCAFTTKFIRREFIGDLRCREVRHMEDWYFNEELQKKNPTELFTHIVAYHYNHPRKGSLCEEMNNGILT